jgi:hypothetical protein
VATAGDVGRVVVHGAIVADGGRLVAAPGSAPGRAPGLGRDPADLLRAALAGLPTDDPHADGLPAEKRRSARR